MKPEIETTINIYGDEPYANIYTCDRRYARKLLKLVEDDPQNCILKQKDEYGYIFRVPDSYVKIKPKRSGAPLSQERKEALARYAAAAREAKAATES